jgi:SulP family sulfate permease
LPTLNGTATAIALLCLGTLVAWQWMIPRLGGKRLWADRLALVPGSVVALLLATLCVAWFKLPVETIGSRFGGIPSGLPTLQWPDFSWSSARFLFIPAITLALLGAIESLLCARVADGMIGERHNPNQELMAQGTANFVTPFFGGMPATGTIARTVTNVKSGATSPVAGIVHAITLLLVIVLAAPLAHHIPLAAMAAMAAMAAILMFVAWNMGEWREFLNLRQFRLPYRTTLLAVFFLTVVFDLTVAVEVGLVEACITFIYRISSLSRCEAVHLANYPTLAHQSAQVAAYRLYGAIFFGAVQLVENLSDHLPKSVLVLDLKNVIYIDSSGADALMDLARACAKNGVQLRVCGLNHQPLDITDRVGLTALIDNAHMYPDLNAALFGAALQPGKIPVTGNTRPLP